MNRYTKILGISLLCLSLATGCKKILDIHSSHAVDENNFWNSHDDTRTALIGAYGLMRAALSNDDAYWMYGDLRDGDFKSYQRQDLKAIIDGNLNASFPLLDDLSNWRRFYAVINACNMFLEHVGEVKARDPRYSEQNMKVDIANIRFLRAFAYFFMVRIWGDVPLITTSHDGQFQEVPRTDQAKVLAFCEQELQAAAADLPYLYSSNDPQQIGLYYNEDAGRWQGAIARKLSAYAVLAHVAAWEGKYADVAAYTKFIMDNYSKEGHSFISTSTLTNSNGIFAGRTANQMVAFNFVYAHAEASYSGHIEELTLAQPLIDKQYPDIYVPKNTITSVFNEVNDQRFSLDTLIGLPTSENYFTDFNTQIPIFSKIKVIRDGNSSNPSFRIFSSAVLFTRLEEIALLRAEALAINGDQAGAIEMLNDVRGERGLKNYNAALNGDLISAIFAERRRELMGEGWRWYDLVRYNRIKQSDPDFMQLINDGGIYWPVAKEIIQNNKLITQNAYWK